MSKAAHIVFPTAPEAKFDFFTHSRCEQLLEERWRPRSSSLSIWVDPDPNLLLQLLDLSNASDSLKDDSDITYLKLHAIYENLLRL